MMLLASSTYLGFIYNARLYYIHQNGECFDFPIQDREIKNYGTNL